MTDLALRNSIAVFGLGLVLIAASMLERPLEAAPRPEPLGEVQPPLAVPTAARASEPALAPTRLANALAEPSFIDTRMPVSTWRAISRQEQKLIERWDSSPEKSLGLASLTEWLDANGRVDGVDLTLLKSKLYRA
jgi:hypothetical protein